MTTDRHPGIIYPWRISELHPLLFVGSAGTLPTKANYITSSPALSNRQGGLFSCPHFRPKSTLFDKKRQKRHSTKFDKNRRKAQTWRQTLKSLQSLAAQGFQGNLGFANARQTLRHPSNHCGARVSGFFQGLRHVAQVSPWGGRSTPQGSTRATATPHRAGGPLPGADYRETGTRLCHL